MSYDKLFEDIIDEINKKAKSQGYKNGLDWAKKAYRLNELTYEEKSNYESAHNLRNCFSHGHANEINISLKTIRFLKHIKSKLLKSKLMHKQVCIVRKQNIKKHNENHKSKVRKYTSYGECYRVNGKPYGYGLM